MVRGSNFLAGVPACCSDRISEINLVTEIGIRSHAPARLLLPGYFRYYLICTLTKLIIESRLRIEGLGWMGVAMLMGANGPPENPNFPRTIEIYL